MSQLQNIDQTEAIKITKLNNTLQTYSKCFERAIPQLKELRNNPNMVPPSTGPETVKRLKRRVFVLTFIGDLKASQVNITQSSKKLYSIIM
jgi:hypothetical protein